MSYKLEEIKSNSGNYGSSRPLNYIKYIVVHYTSNDGDTARNNGRYFQNNIVQASAHYFVDDDTIVHSVPDDITAWSVGGRPQSNHHPLYGVVTNSNSISVEMCDTCRNGKVEITEQTLINTYSLVKSLMDKYNIPIGHVIRHYDVNGKLCPNCNGLLDDNVWETFKKNVVNSTSNPLGNSNVIPNNTVNKNTDNVIARGQRYLNEFTDSSIDVDGIFGPETRKAMIKALQKSCNKDYNSNIKMDGYWGPNTSEALGNHYVRRGETQYLVSFVEIALMCRGYDPSGLEYPGIFGDGLHRAVSSFQRSRGLTIDGIAGRNTITRLLGV